MLPSITLRALEPEDLDFLYTTENDRTLWDDGCNNVPYSRNLLRNYIGCASGDIYIDRQVRLVVADAAGVPVGLLDLVNFAPDHARAEVSIVIAPAARGHGYGAAALARLTAYAAHTLRLHQLYAVVRADNAASIALFRTAGFAHAATLPDWLRKPGVADQYEDALLMRRKL